MEMLKPAKPTEQTSVSEVESAECQKGQQQEPSTVQTSFGHTQPKGTEVPQAVKSIPSDREILYLIASKYLEDISPMSKEDYKNFLTYMEKIAGVSVGTLVITVKCVSLQILEQSIVLLFTSLSEYIRGSI